MPPLRSPFLPSGDRRVRLLFHVLLFQDTSETDSTASFLDSSTTEPQVVWFRQFHHGTPCHKASHSCAQHVKRCMSHAGQDAAERAVARVAQAAVRHATRVAAARVADAGCDDGCAARHAPLAEAQRLTEAQRLQHVRNWHEATARRADGKAQEYREAKERWRQLCASNTPEGIAARTKQALQDSRNRARDRERRAAISPAVRRAKKRTAAARARARREGDTPEAVEARKRHEEELRKRRELGKKARDAARELRKGDTPEAIEARKCHAARQLKATQRRRTQRHRAAAHARYLASRPTTEAGRLAMNAARRARRPSQARVARVVTVGRAAHNSDEDNDEDMVVGMAAPPSPAQRLVQDVPFLQVPAVAEAPRVPTLAHDQESRRVEAIRNNGFPFHPDAGPSREFLAARSAEVAAARDPDSVFQCAVCDNRLMGKRSQVDGVLAVADLHGSALMQLMRTHLSDCKVPVSDGLRACYTVNHPELRGVLLSPRGAIYSNETGLATHIRMCGSCHEALKGKVRAPPCTP